MELSLNNVVPDLRDHFDEGLCSFDELISLGVIWQPLPMKQSGHLYVIHESHYNW